jgi:ribonuclease HI
VTTLTLKFSGGCTGERFGSFIILHGEKEISRENHIELGHGTANEAEWLACISGLARIIAECTARKRALAAIRLEILTDSTLVATRLLKEPSSIRPQTGTACKLWVLAHNAWRLLRLFGGHSAKWCGKDGSVQNFGR